jgi:hypothetical protein
MVKLTYLMRNLFSAKNLFIRNKDLHICSNCIYFIEHKNNFPCDSLPSDILYGKCKKFGEVDIITGIVKYDFANICRDNNKKCGKYGYHFISKIKS